MFCQSNDFFYSCHIISKLSYLFNIGLWEDRDRMFTNHRCLEMVKQKQCCKVIQKHKCEYLSVLLVATPKNQLKGGPRSSHKTKASRANVIKLFFVLNLELFTKLDCLLNYAGKACHRQTL